MAGETIKLDADVSGYVAGVAKAEAATRKLATAERAAGDAAAEASKTTRSLSDRLGDLNKVNNATGGSFSAITGPLDDYGDLIERVGKKQATMAVGAGLVIGAFVKIGAAVFDVFKNVESYRDSLNSLQNRGIISSGDVLALEQASAAMTALSSQMGGWATEIAVRIAPTVSKFLMGTAYALEYVESLIRTWSFDQAGKDATKAAKEIYDAMQAAGVAAQKTTQTTQAHTSAVQTNTAATQAAAKAAEERARRLEEESAALDALMERDIARSAQASADAANIAAFHAQPQGAQDAQQGVQTFGGEMGGIGFRMQEFDFKEDPLIALDTARAESAKKTAQQVAGEWSSYLNVAAGTAANFATIVLGIGNAIIRGTEQDTRRAKKKQFAIEKAAAIASATISMFQAIASNLTIPPIAVGAALAAVAGAAGAVQIGLIAAQQPKFHRGGILPDEIAQSGMTTRQNESTAVLTAQAMRALGGQEGINRANAGQAPAAAPTYLVVDGAPRLARSFAGPDPGYGMARRGLHA
jgi:hypothetical protein